MRKNTLWASPDNSVC